MFVGVLDNQLLVFGRVECKLKQTEATPIHTGKSQAVSRIEGIIKVPGGLHGAVSSVFVRSLLLHCGRQEEWHPTLYKHVRPGKSTVRCRDLTTTNEELSGTRMAERGRQWQIESSGPSVTRPYLFFVIDIIKNTISGRLMGILRSMYAFEKSINAFPTCR